MCRDYVGLASIFQRLAMAPDAMVGSSDIGCQDEARNAIKTITGRIVYVGKKVRISGALESPNVIVVRTIDEVD
jgi:hypothetical protein